MRLLLDTHTFLWFIGGDPQLKTHIRETLEDEQHELYLSIASVWEIGIKVSINKLTMPEPFDEFIAEQLAVNGIDLLPVTLNHIGIVIKLPLHHRDPFDRLLIAQAVDGDLIFVTADSALEVYPVKRLS